ncbi:MAG: class II fructose-bisphosphate aldolase, partial [Armatimonadota bacterium]
MSFVNITKMLKDAEAGHYAVGAFNYCNAETAKAIIDEGARKKSPVMMICGPWELDLVGPNMLVKMVDILSEEAGVEVCLHLDHATDVETVKRCIDAGFPSVMIDGSHCNTYEENVTLTRMVVEMAKPFGITVEGELGSVGRVDDCSPEANDKSLLTDPAQAAEFERLTGVDALAVGIGNGHGMYPQSPVLDFERLQEIRNVVTVPIVLHGGSGTPAHQLHQAIDLGVSKVNVASELGRS